MILKLALSITGFIPLYLLMIIIYLRHFLNKDTNVIVKNYILLSIGIIFFVLLLCLIIVVFYIRDKEDTSINENTIKFSNIKENKKAHVDYMMTYLLPLLLFNTDNIDSFNILYANLLIAFFIYMNARGENFSVNIILGINGYRIYTGINIEGEEKILLIKKKKLSNLSINTSKYEFVPVAGSKDIYLCKKYFS